MPTVNSVMLTDAQARMLQYAKYRHISDALSVEAIDHHSYRTMEALERKGLVARGHHCLSWALLTPEGEAIHDELRRQAEDPTP